MRVSLGRAVSVGMLSAVLLLGGCSGGGAAVQFPHIHGLGFTPDGQELMVPAHDGMRIYRNGKWQAPDLPKHDYMGYAPTDNGFYSSGHPAPGSSLPNPLGLVKSADQGKTLQTLAFTGEIDFHTMGAGYYSHAVYVVNPAPNPKLPAGLHYTLDEGKSWKAAAGAGVTGPVYQLAVHPRKPEVVALATEGGLFLSEDHGATFAQVGDLKPVSAVAFSPDGSSLYFGLTQLMKHSPAGGVEPVQAPPLGEKDAIAYIAVNPATPDQIAVATFGVDIYQTTDGGKAWKALAVKGKGQ